MLKPLSQAALTAMLMHFALALQNIIEVAAKAAEYPINSLDFVDDTEREVVLEKFNATAKQLPPPYNGATIHGLFEHWATQNPNARAISFEVSFPPLTNWYELSWLAVRTSDNQNSIPQVYHYGVQHAAWRHHAVSHSEHVFYL